MFCVRIARDSKTDSCRKLSQLVNIMSVDFGKFVCLRNIAVQKADLLQAQLIFGKYFLVVVKNCSKKNKHISVTKSYFEIVVQNNRSNKSD